MLSTAPATTLSAGHLVGESIDLQQAARIFQRNKRPIRWAWISCAACSRVILIKIEAARNGQRFCSTACGLTSPRRHPTKGKTGLWTRTDVSRWAYHKRANILKPPGPCERCGGPGQVVHHQDENPANNSLDNLERLCRPCHINHHREAVKMTSSTAQKAWITRRARSKAAPVTNHA